jgi:hypothetical protein
MLHRQALPARLRHRREPGEEGDQEAGVVDPLLADQLPLVEMLLHPAFEGDGVDGRQAVAAADALRRLASGVERAGVAAAAEAVGALLGHADPFGGPFGDAEIGQRLDIFALPRRRPAVVARLHRHGLELRHRSGVGGRSPLVGRGSRGDAVWILVHLTG